MKYSAVTTTSMLSDTWLLFNNSDTAVGVTFLYGNCYIDTDDAASDDKKVSASIQFCVLYVDFT